MKSILITGAGRGIGLALTQIFTEQGFQVLATYRNEKTAKDLLQFAKNHPTVTTITADVTDEKSLGPLKDQLKKIGSLDILINNAGVIGNKARPLLELDMKEVVETFKTNTLGAMYVTRVAIPFLSKNAKVAQISSLMGSITDSSGGYYDYRMSKAALNMFNNCLSKEFPNLIFLTLHPGWVQTDMGGAGATVTPEDSARGLNQVIVKADLKQSGKFLDFRGQQLPW